MTLTQTVEVPDTRLLTIKLPREIPAGKARLLIFPVKEEIQAESLEQPEISSKATLPKGKIGMTRKQLEEFLKNAHTPISDSLVGIIPNPENKSQDELRMEGMMDKYGEHFE